MSISTCCRALPQLFCWGCSLRKTAAIDPENSSSSSVNAALPSPSVLRHCLCLVSSFFFADGGLDDLEALSDGASDESPKLKLKHIIQKKLHEVVYIQICCCVFHRDIIRLSFGNIILINTWNNLWRTESCKKRSVSGPSSLVFSFSLSSVHAPITDFHFFFFF